MWISKLLDVLKSHELGLQSKQYHWKSISTSEASQQIVDCKKNEDKIYDEVVKERLQTYITVRTFCVDIKKAATQQY